MIKHDKKTGIITINTKNTTYQMQADTHGILLHLYYGRKIHFDASHTIQYADRGFSGNPYDLGNDRTYSLDALPLEYPFYGEGDYRNPALIIKNEKDGSLGLDLRVSDIEISKGKYSLKGLPASYGAENEAETLSVTLKDSITGLTVRLLYGVFEGYDVITRAVKLTNEGTAPLTIKKAASAALDFLYGDYRLISFYGRHAMERNLCDSLISHGRLSIGSNRGTSSHQYNPFVILADSGTNEDFGGCIGVHLMYSGSFEISAEKDQYDQTRLVAGLSGICGELDWLLQPGEDFDTPEVILTYSKDGLTHLSHNTHSFINNCVIRGSFKDKRRPILINNWEATYFDFDGERLINIAKDAKNLGIELFVLDDGWFGKREDDNTGLGDWKVNTGKLGMTLGELSRRINELGLSFGLWFEPEAVSEDSDMYRAHPEYCLRIPSRPPVRARYQLMLDFSRQEVVDFVYEMLVDIFDNANISYMKWDMNRSLSDFYSDALSKDRQGEVSHRYVLGVYDLLERLIKRYPDMLIEGCSGGGGRFDAGMLYYTPQVWCSDNTDAIDRLFIQYGTSFGYPISAVGSHVSAVPNHQTGRTTPFNTRGIVAMSGTFGYELDPAKLTDEEREALKTQIERFKKDYDLIRHGDYYRLTSPYSDKELCAWMFVSKDKKTAVINAVSLNNHGNPVFKYINPKGLIPDAIYHIEESDEAYPGDALMYAGLPLPYALEEYEGIQWHLNLT